MIKLDIISDTELRVFENKTVLVYGIKKNPYRLSKLLKNYGITVMGCCIEGSNFTQRMKLLIRGIKCISPSKIDSIAKRTPSLMIQSIGFDATEICSIHQKFKALNVKCSPLASGEIVSVLSSQTIVSEFKNPLIYKRRELFWRYRCAKKTNYDWNHFKQKKHNDPVVICSPPKTADITLNSTFNQLNKNNADCKINYINLSHKARFLDKAFLKNSPYKIKIIVGIREPVSQNLSRLFQEISTGILDFNWMLGDLKNKSSSERIKILNQYSELLKRKDLQLLWNCFVQRYVYPEGNIKKLSCESKSIQSFFQDFKIYVEDITRYPFNKEKGYTIINKNNMEIFVYQLEKLNSIVPELSEWIGVPFDKLEKGNAAEDKWIAESYKQAQKEIGITQEYFDKCFDEPYVKHCYSEADIEKFKARWRPHIKK